MSAHTWSASLAFWVAPTMDQGKGEGEDSEALLFFDHSHKSLRASRLANEWLTTGHESVTCVVLY